MEAILITLVYHLHKNYFNIKIILQNKHTSFNKTIKSQIELKYLYNYNFKKVQK
jgi:hypothetical protein